ncbi:hypothetical protein BDZ89DRAFT_1102271 [Hymenopellis radicata]|nr:hypothetical protein BDZ89DRAFT_1102271 [Hymenopellis radicata]
MPILESFKLKPYDLEPLFAIWVPPPPTFTGAQPVDEWLTQIRTGCTERNVPREYWHKVAQHYIGPKAKKRLDELKAVMTKVHGAKYRWNWDKYKIAMRNMAVRCIANRSGFWFLSRKNSKDGEEIVEEPIPLPETKPMRPNQTCDRLGRVYTTRPPPSSGSKSFAGSEFFKSLRGGSTSDTKDVQAQRPTPQKTKSDTIVVTSPAVATREVAAPVRSNSNVTTVAHAPIWLINASNALDFLNNEHPKVMSTLSAILITAGTLPTIPAVAAGVGGTVLASGAVHAVGAIAVGIGSWLRASQEASANRQAESAASGSATGK